MKDQANPWECPVCKFPGPHQVADSYEVAGVRKRRRVCNNCGQGLIRTQEVPVPEGFKLQIVPDREPPKAGQKPHIGTSAV